MPNYNEMLKLADEEGLQSIPVDNEALKLLDPMETPIYQMILAKGNGKMVRHGKFEWPEGNHTGIMTEVATAYDASITTIVVDDASIFKKKMLVKNTTTDEVMLIEGVNYTTDTLTVYRGVGNSGTGIAGSVDDDIILVGAAEDSGGLVGDSIVTPPTDKYNYIQHFSEPIKISDYRKRSDENMGVGMREEDLLARALQKHYREFELVLINGKRDAVTSTIGTHYITGGLKYFISDNVNDNGGSLGTITQDNFDAFVKTCFNRGANRKMLFGGSGPISAINKFGKDNILQNKDNKLMELGFVVTTYVTPFGELDVVHHRLMNEMGMSDAAFILDMDEIWTRYFPPEKTATESKLEDITELRLNIQSGERHAHFHEYQTYQGFQIMNQITHGYLYNVSGGA